MWRLHRLPTSRRQHATRNIYIQSAVQVHRHETENAGTHLLYSTSFISNPCIFTKISIEFVCSLYQVWDVKTVSWCCFAELKTPSISQAWCSENASRIVCTYGALHVCMPCLMIAMCLASMLAGSYLKPMQERRRPWRIRCNFVAADLFIEVTQ